MDGVTESVPAAAGVVALSAFALWLGKLRPTRGDQAALELEAQFREHDIDEVDDLQTVVRTGEPAPFNTHAPPPVHDPFPNLT